MIFVDNPIGTAHNVLMLVFLAALAVTVIGLTGIVEDWLVSIKRGRVRHHGKHRSTPDGLGRLIVRHLRLPRR